MPIASQIHPAPSLALLGLEPVRAFIDFLHSRMAGDSPLPRGNAEPVLVIPGLATNEASTAVLRDRLSGLNYRVEDWGQGLNKGPQDNNMGEWLAPVLLRIEALAQQTGKKVTLIGWSLGGIAARELSKAAPHLVQKVITLGTPFSELEGSTNAGGAYEMLNGGKKASLPPELAEQFRNEPPVDTVSIFSKSDGIVGWSACVQAQAHRTRHIEVPGVSHFGLVFSPRVLDVLAHELARPQSLMS